MADIEQQPLAEEAVGADVEMQEGAEGTDDEESGLLGIEPETPKLVLFADLAKSPIVEVMVGTGDECTTYSAHEAVLIKAPEFARQCANLGPGVIAMPDADVNAMGSIIEYLYTGEYFPKKTSTARDATLEKDPRTPLPDDQGLGLLVHARIYTLADRLEIPELKSLAHSKIHRTASTAKGELAYARFIYKESNPEDAVIRKPVAAFWATRSYSLRHDAEPEFKAMCLEFPQFSYDVLQLVLDQQEKSRHKSDDGPHRGPAIVPGSSRKRARVNQI
ncbi:uncharacterized protein BDR25DRAFT_46787 [Lindgomyces ingoldianus]|uniref:Uncharacterized protein n=1 Tax=Lindgomyces ingoldianus TaxID=673940 RepID=A0ACB6QRY1_9PLEO|nr:uncharacterized protein BDR25DRAFT_46787 [Lindgomyces ingoldianus]KAF2469650.1 hypothetical protein BDR25DRAFT_46787 [Lindgomyces ingoldianus]